MCVEISRKAGRVGLVIKTDKTKCMRLSASPSRRSVKGATVKGVTYEGVAESIYLGTLISYDNSVEKDIQRRVLTGNRIYFATTSLFRIRLLSRAAKDTNKTGSVVWSGSMDVDEERRTSCANF